ncbi:MAG: hypothetical protein ACJ75A_06100 [Actinomycetes bacterium]|jgi:PiT family inorganic phosphate transporter
MDLALLTVIGIVVVALLFDYTNGFHDSANSISTIVAKRARPTPSRGSARSAKSPRRGW